MDAAFQLEPARQVSRADKAFLASQKARQDGDAAGLQGALDVLSEEDQGPGQDIGKDQRGRGDKSPFPP
jgi:hypothetical protein